MRPGTDLFPAFVLPFLRGGEKEKERDRMVALSIGIIVIIGVDYLLMRTLTALLP